MNAGMLKKLALFCCIYAATAEATFASPYLGASLGIQNTKSYNGLLATLAGGYSLSFCDDYYLAGELFFDTGSIPFSQNYYRRTNFGFGASIIPGYVFRQSVLAYLRMGVETFRYSGTLQMFTGGQLGLGLQMDLSKTWALRGEYIYTGAGIIHDFGEGRFNFFKLGLIYKFI